MALRVLKTRLAWKTNPRSKDLERAHRTTARQHQTLRAPVYEAMQHSPVIYFSFRKAFSKDSYIFLNVLLQYTTLKELKKRKIDK